MVSFDVEALYTNVPIDNTLEIIKKLLENNKTLLELMPLSLKTVMDLLEFLLHTICHFQWHNYQKTEGVAMGGSPSSIVAEIYMQGTETIALTPTSHPPKVDATLMTSSLLYENPTHMTFFNISTAFTTGQSLPCKLKKTESTTPFPSESTGNPHTHRPIPEIQSHHLAKQRKVPSHYYSTGQRASLATLPTKKKNKSSHNSTPSQLLPEEIHQQHN